MYKLQVVLTDDVKEYLEEYCEKHFLKKNMAIRKILTEHKIMTEKGKQNNE